MSNQIEKAFVNQFHAGFAQAFQQSKSILRPYVEVVRQSGEFDYYDRIGIADDMTEDNVRYGDNPISEISHERRQIFIKDYHIGKPIEEKDLMRVATDPTSDYMQALVASANRKVDDIIISRLTAVAKIGKAGETSVSFASNSSGKVNVGALSDVQTRIVNGTYFNREAGTEGIAIQKNYTGGTPADTGLTLAKLKGVRETMMKLDVISQDEILNCFIATRQFNDLLGINEVINSDYSTRKNLAEGNVTTFGGFRFIHCERLPLASSTRSCFVFKPQAFKLALGKDITASMWRLPEKRNIPYLYVKLAMGGTRMWGECMAKVDCHEA